MFAASETEKIANLLIKGWNEIIETLAPNKRIQIKIDNEDIVTDEARELKKKHDEAIDRAITNKDGEEFRLAKSIKIDSQKQ